jgi:bacitracin transport ATP-binding protein BcrA
VREVSMDKVRAEYPSGLEDYFMDIMTGRKENENDY